MAVFYLCAWGADVNAQDIEGFTPLHIAVQVVNETESKRIIRTLVMRGANREIRDKNGKRPIDYVFNISNQKTKQEVQKFLVRFKINTQSEKSFGNCINPKTPKNLAKKSHFY
jgi:ankyrin repeat protein